MAVSRLAHSASIQPGTGAVRGQRAASLPDLGYIPPRGLRLNFRNGSGSNNASQQTRNPFLVHLVRLVVVGPCCSCLSLFGFSRAVPCGQRSQRVGERVGSGLCGEQVSQNYSEWTGSQDKLNRVGGDISQPTKKACPYTICWFDWHSAPPEDRASSFPLSLVGNSHVCPHCQPPPGSVEGGAWMNLGREAETSVSEWKRFLLLSGVQKASGRPQTWDRWDRRACLGSEKWGFVQSQPRTLARLLFSSSFLKIKLFKW